ncbi:TPA: L-rhamnose mutarotase [Vibrio parahaemolyticus]
MNDVIRKAFVMQLNEGCKEEYQKRHDEIWPELVDVLKSHGGHNYSIFLHEATNQLFGYVEIESEERWQQVARTESCQKWWSYMQDIMATNPDNSPQSIPLDSVFYLA